MVGLPAPNTGATDETLIVNAINSLAGLPEPIRPEDIDISHSLPSRRRDGRPVHVVRFVHRKNKFAEELKKIDSSSSGIMTYISTNTSTSQIVRFANEKKRTLGYRFVWTKSGVVNMRKDKLSEVITIRKTKDFEKLQ